MAQCENCGSKADKSWEFCPSCGASLRVADAGDLFSEIFERFGQEFAEMNKMFERQIEAVDITPMFRKPKGIQRGGGFIISIGSSGDKQPQVSVRAFGDVDERKIKQQVYNQLGQVEEKPFEQKAPKKVKAYGETEEPKTRVEKVGDKVVVEMELPGVKKDSDIEINELESSVEVKAIADKKAFFKILKKPGDRRILRTGFNKGILKLEFS